MKFTVSTSDLQRILAKLAGVIPSKSTMPILETLLFELTNNALSITATDLVVSSTIQLDVTGTEDGTIAIPAKRLVDTMRSLPDTGVTFVIDMTTNKIKLSTTNGEYALTGEAAKEYPVVPPFKGSSEVTIESSALRKLVHRTAFAVSTDELRPAMMGILIQASGPEIRAVATDGHRLARASYKTDIPARLGKDVIIPAKAMAILAKAVESGSCTVGISDTHIRFVYDHSVLVSRIIEETYPNYESVIPQDNAKIAIVNRDQVIASIRRVSLYASMTTHQVKLELGANSLKLSAQDVDFGGEATETLPCEYNGDALEIGFNAVYLSDILSHLDTERVMMKFSTPTRAGIVVPAEESQHESTVMLIMPVRLNS
jgi:DNA polymerase III subunit beta